MSNFKLAVITINRNNAEGLRKTIESVLSQPNLPQEKFEYIIVDGASTDGSVEVIKEFETRTDLPLKITSWTSEPDTGIYNAMNKGIKKATGTLIQMLNSGDWLCEDVLARVFKKHIEMPDTILYGAINNCRNGEFIDVSGWNHDKNLRKAMIPHQAIFVPNKIYKENDAYSEEYRLASDYECILRFYLKGIPFYYLNQIICNYDLDGMTTQNIDVSINERHQIQKKYGIFVDKPLLLKIYHPIKKSLRKLLFKNKEYS